MKRVLSVSIEGTVLVEKFPERGSRPKRLGAWKNHAASSCKKH